MVSIGPFKLLLYPKPNFNFSKCAPINHLKKTDKIKSMNLIFVVPGIMLYSSEISPTRCNNCVFILRNGFTLHVSGDNLTHHQEYPRNM